MKNLLFLTIAFLLSVSNSFVTAQKKIKEGKIKYEMTYPDSGESKEMLAMMPKDMIIYFKDGDIRTEMKMAMVGDVSMIRYAKTGDSYTLMDIMDHKTAMKMTKDDVDHFKGLVNNEKPEVKITDETKIIAGIKCKKAIVTKMFKGEKKTIDIWFTKDIDAMNSTEYSVPGIDGFQMEFTTSDKGMTVRGLCTSVEQIAVSDSLFKIPEGYEVMNMDEMMKGFGGK